HRLRQEYALIHRGGITANDRLEVHLRENVPFDVDAGGDFGELQPVFGELEHAALGHIEDGLSAFHGIAAGKRPMLDLADEFLHDAVVDDIQSAVFDGELQSAGREGADEHHLLGILADVDEAAGPRQTWPEFADV